MAFDEVFAAALIDNNERFRVFGVSLRPFSLWHLMLLQVIDSPFLRSGNVELFDLKTAAGICRLRYRQSKVHRPRLPLLCSRPALLREVGKFIDYVGAYISRPEYNIVPPDVGRGVRPPRTITPPPSIISTAYHAAHGARVSIQEAWDMPLGEAYISEAMYFRHMGQQVDFLGAEERLLQYELRKAGIH